MSGTEVRPSGGFVNSVNAVCVPFQRPTMPDSRAIDRYFDRARDAHFYSNGGPCALELQRRVEIRIGGGHAILVNNATSGLMITARAVFGRQRSSGYVVVPSFTFAATATALLWAGYEPLFCDVDPEGLHMDPDALSSLLRQYGDSVAGILACSTFGVAPRREVAFAWEAVSRRFGVPLIVDSAAGFGSENEAGSVLGHQGVAEVFSFHATKPFAVGEGGVITTDDANLAKEIRSLINFGFNAERVIVGPAGINAKMPEILCAIGLAVDDEFDTVLETRRGLAKEMATRLTRLGANVQPNLGRAAIQFMPITVEEELRQHVLRKLESKGIEARKYFDPALHMMATFADFPRGPLPVTETLTRTVVSLPMSNVLSRAQGSEIVQAVEDGIASAGVEVACSSELVR